MSNTSLTAKRRSFKASLAKYINKNGSSVAIVAVLFVVVVSVDAVVVIEVAVFAATHAPVK